MQFPHLVVLDGNQSHLPQSVTLHAIVHNITQAIEFIAFSEFLLSLSDGSGHPKAESTATINLNYHIPLSSL